MSASSVRIARYCRYFFAIIQKMANNNKAMNKVITLEMYLANQAWVRPRINSETDVAPNMAIKIPLMIGENSFFAGFDSSLRKGFQNPNGRARE